jgi:hypothetical protein
MRRSLEHANDGGFSGAGQSHHHDISPDAMVRLALSTPTVIPVFSWMAFLSSPAPDAALVDFPEPDT